jgi:pimeloyl-ACP methyl ester carboxylesterase
MERAERTRLRRAGRIARKRPGNAAADSAARAAVQRGNKLQAVTAAGVKALRMPLLAVVGGANPIEAGVEAFRQIKPDLTVVVIDGAPHSGARGAPGRPEFVAAVRDFLSAHKSPTSQ